MRASPGARPDIRQRAIGEGCGRVGLLVRRPVADEERWLRFVDGRPVSDVTTWFLAWGCERVAAAGATTLVLVWDNAAWHGSKTVRQWIQAHNRQVHQAGGVRIVPSLLPIKSPWRNPIESKWIHDKRRVVDPARLLTASEVEDRVCAAFGAPRVDHLVIPQEVA